MRKGEEEEVPGLELSSKKKEQKPKEEKPKEEKEKPKKGQVRLCLNFGGTYAAAGMGKCMKSQKPVQRCSKMRPIANITPCSSVLVFEHGLNLAHITIAS